MISMLHVGFKGDAEQLALAATAAVYFANPGMKFLHLKMSLWFVYAVCDRHHTQTNLHVCLYVSYVCLYMYVCVRDAVCVCVCDTVRVCDIMCV